MSVKKLYRSREDKVLCGVCGGLGEYLGIDPNIIRLLAVLLLFVSAGLVIILYLVACILLPEKPSQSNTAEGTKRQVQ